MEKKFLNESGVLYLRTGRKIEAGASFVADEADIPKAFMDTIKELGDTPKASAPAVKVVGETAPEKPAAPEKKAAPQRTKKKK